MLRSAERALSEFVANGVKMGWGPTLTWSLFFGKVCKWLIFWGNTSLITLETTVDGQSGLWSRKNNLVSFIAVNHNRKIPAPLSRFVSVSQSIILLLSTTLNFPPRSVNCTSSSCWHQHEFWIVPCNRATFLKRCCCRFHDLHLQRSFHFSCI